MDCLRSITERQGRCYELALFAILHEIGAEHFVLTHGRINNGAGVSIPHAWIQVSTDRIYDPVFDRYFVSADYLAHAVVEARYTHPQAHDMFVRLQSYGPWHD